MLQEGEQTVTFQPMHDEYVPWHIGLFHLYLVLVALIALVRSARVIWSLRSQRVAIQHSENFLQRRSQDFWEYSCAVAQSLKSLSNLTVLISVIEMLWSLADVTTQIATQKTAGSQAIAGALANTLRNASAGFIVSAALFCVSILCEHLIRSRRVRGDEEIGKGTTR